MLQEVDLGEEEDFGGTDLTCCLVHDVDSTEDIVSLECQESGVLHRDVGDCLGVLLGQCRIQCLVKEFLNSLVGAHSALEADECKGGLHVSWRYLIGKGFVDHTRLRYLLLFLFEECVFNHKLD